MDFNCLIGSKVSHKKFGLGTIVEIVDNSYFNIDFNGMLKKFMIETFDNFLNFEEESVNNYFQEVLCQLKSENELKKAELEAKRIKKADGVNVINSERTISVRLGGHSQISFDNVVEVDRRLIKAVFNECDETTLGLYDDFNPRMEYPEMTSRSKSRYCVGFLCKYLNTYVLRVFSRMDVYKKRKKSGITILQSDTTEVMRIISIDGTTYYFSKNISRAGGHINNSSKNNFWRLTWDNVVLNEVVRKCDCEYLSDFIEEKNINAREYGKLLLCALYDNKAEILFKHKMFQSAYRISGLSKYLSAFTPKQIDFACKNDVLNAIPVIKNQGLYEVAVLKEMEKVIRSRGWRGSLYDNMVTIFKRLNFDTTDLMQRLVRFVRKVEHLDVAIYSDYVSEIANLNGVAIRDFFDKNYIERHNQIFKENEFGYTTKEEIDYSVAAKELSWIDREYKGYHIIVPKSIDAFKVEGDIQHICVFHMGYFRDVINKQSIIVFLRKDKNVPYVTIEYDYHTFEVLQARGKFNQDLDKDLYQLVVDLGKRLHYEKLCLK